MMREKQLKTGIQDKKGSKQDKKTNRKGFRGCIMLREDKSISKSVEELAGKVVRPDKRLKAEDLVASELATAILSEPLSKIRHTCEALMFLDNNERKSAKITEEENGEALERIYPLCQSFRNVFIDRYTRDTGEVIERSATIRWPFEYYEVSKWAEWLPNEPQIQWYPTSEKDKERLEIRDNEELSEAEKTYECSHARRITIDSKNSLEDYFITRAMPKTARLMKKIISLVSASSFHEALKRVRGGSYASRG